MVTKVGLWEQPSDPATVANKGYVYSKEVNSITELFYKDGSDNVTQLTLQGKVKGNTLNQSYDEGGAGAGRTITVDSGPVTLVAGGLEALRADGYIGLTERIGDPTLITNTGLVYTKDKDGITELYYMNTAGVTTQLTDNGAVPGFNKIQEGNTKAEVHDTGVDGYFYVITEDGEKFRIGPSGGATFTPNTDTNINFNTSGTGTGIFANAIRVGNATDETAGNIRWTGTHFEGYMGTEWNQLDQTIADLTSATTSVITITDGTGAVMGTGTSISINKASDVLDGYLGKDDFASFASGSTITKGDVTEGLGSSVLSFTGNTSAVFGTGMTITVTKASAGADGYLDSADWTTFNNKQDAITPYDLTESNSDVLVISGTNSVLAAATIEVRKASALQDGYLGKDDFTSLSSGANITKGDVTEGLGSSVLSFTGNISAVFGGGMTITVTKASAGSDGYLDSVDWTTFNNKFDDPMTVDGDIIIRSSGVATALPIGTTSQVLTVSAGLPSWQDPAVGTQILAGDTRAYVRDTGSDGYFAVDIDGVEQFRVANAGGVIVSNLGSAPVNTNGMIYYNTGSNKFEFSENGTWNQLGGTLNTAYNYGGAGAGRTITIDSGAVSLVATADEALSITDGYIGLGETTSPTPMLSKGLVYASNTLGVTELYYMDNQGKYTQITDDGYLATANSLYQVGLYTKDWDPHVNYGEGFIYTKWVGVDQNRHSEFYFMNDMAEVTQITKDGSLNMVLTSQSGYRFELAVNDDGTLFTKKL